MKIDGGCFCGKVTYEAEADPADVSICHCRDCQQFTGSAYRVTALVPDAAAIRVTAGTPKTFVKTADNGNRSVQHFCGDCGAPLFFSSETNPQGQWGIRWGSIREREALKPARQIWTKSAAPWIHDLGALPGRIAD
ncbi:MAG: GFA family protein [Afipia sp.]|nr:GFA family protein [Afipia sp.]